ncbi:MAG TPA: ATP-binding protein [Thermoanaerobaculia bacterium]|nr:ATP-binding protein [Thermoanaerobaculia bacterium]
MNEVYPIPGDYLTDRVFCASFNSNMSLSDDFEALDLSHLRRLVENRQEEHLSLEFKRVSTSDLTDASDKKNFARALSGFANADGGLVIWGVATSRRGNVDIASEERPINDSERFVGRLNEFTGVLVNPRVEGVRHKKIELVGHSGFAVTIVPASEGGPHMAKAGIDQYLRRHGDRFQVMEHYEVADMFGRRPRAQLEVECALSDGGWDSKRRNVRVLLRLRNTGRAAASAPFVAVVSDENGTRFSHASLTQFSRSDDGVMRTIQVGDGSIAFVGLRGLVLPPGPLFEVASVLLGFELGVTVFPRRVHVSASAENAPLREFSFEFTRDELVEIIGEKGHP